MGENITSLAELINKQTAVKTFDGLPLKRCTDINVALRMNLNKDASDPKEFLSWLQQ